VAEALSQIKQGHVVIGVYSLPHRCPPAPIELAMLTHFYYLTRGLRDKVKITVVHPLKRPFENFGPMAAKWMSGFLQQLGIEYVGVGQGQAIKSIGKNELELTNGERVKFDAAFVVPPHKASDPVLNSDLAKNGCAAQPCQRWLQKREIQRRVRSRRRLTCLSAWPALYSTATRRELSTTSWRISSACLWAIRRLG